MPDEAATSKAEQGLTQRRAERRGEAISPAPGIDGREWVAIEEPLEIRAGGVALAITMRTPGDDAALAAGFLLAEGILISAQDIGAIETDATRFDERLRNVVDVLPSPGHAFLLESIDTARRGTLTTAACGVCGRRSIDDMLSRCTPLEEGAQIETSAIERAMQQLRGAQANFARSGGVHAAAAFDAAGNLLACAEDVGRHNATDKVIGRLLLEGKIGSGADAPALLAVSGRASFEIVQKAIMARIPIVASVSAASSLAIDLALKARLTLAAFVREGRLTLYAHPGRVV